MYLYKFLLFEIRIKVDIGPYQNLNSDMCLKINIQEILWKNCIHFIMIFCALTKILTQVKKV